MSVNEDLVDNWLRHRHLLDVFEGAIGGYRRVRRQGGGGRQQGERREGSDHGRDST